MRTLVHISDLHFGHHEQSLVPALADAVSRAGPDIVAVSGDLTEHATATEFTLAADFLRRIPGVHIVVPGNHDLSFYNPVRRVWQRLALYKRYVTPDLEPSYSDDEISVVGVNTARVPLFRGGHMSEPQIRKIERNVRRGDRIRIVVTHHPFEGIVRTRAVARLLAGVDILLAGHMHRSGSGPTALALSAAGQSAIFVQAGTGLSLRRPNEPNAFNVLRVEGSLVRVEVWRADSSGRYCPHQTSCFERTESGWRQAEPLPLQ